jgi:hypothetical protein
MTDTSSREPRFDETPPSATRQVAASDWNRFEIDAQPEPPPLRERVFSRKVLIGWALFAVVIYFGVGVVRNVIRETVRASVAAAADQIPRNSTTIYRTPNGKITISRSPTGSIIISRDRPDVPGPPTPAATAAPRAPIATPAPTAPPAKR